jgi:hypothetical protein
VECRTAGRKPIDEGAATLLLIPWLCRNRGFEMGLTVPAPLGILQNVEPLMLVGHCPIPDLLQGAKAS